MTATRWLILVLATAAWMVTATPKRGSAAEALPEPWQAAWKRPPLADRPLQIVHGIDPRRAMPEGIGQMIHQKDPLAKAPEGMRYYIDRGLGGIVCNVAFADYMRSEQHWKTLLAALEQCRKLGMVVWLYDEKGYPSGAAGGLVLAEDRRFEATELAFDASRDDPFIVRPAYEHTHASNNYHAARRYINLLDDRATRCFLDKTHETYWKRLEPLFGGTIQATFTDEPSLIAVNIGQIPEAVRKRVPVDDALDPAVAPLPRVPWCYDLPQRYRERYGEDLIPGRRSLFAGTADADRHVRRQFWSLVAELVADRYFGQIGRWCKQHHVASSGHSLWEEQILHHVPLEGNGLEILARMDIPGLDMLSSDPQTVIHSGWMTAALPASAAILTGGRRVMTEVSDFSQKMGGAGPAGLAEMQATAAWQAAWSVTEFTLYYSLADRPAETSRAYGDYVGRLNAILKPAQPAPQVLLYYPVYDLWAEYLPVAERLTLESQSPRARQIVASFMRIGQTLQRSQIPFALIDHRRLAEAKLQTDGTLAAGAGRFKAVLLPEGCQPPPETARLLDAFVKQGGRVISERAGQALPIDELRPPCRIDPPAAQIAMGRFLRDSRQILLLVNVGAQPYQGRLAGLAAGDWLTLDPATAAVRRADETPAGGISLSLAARQSLLLVHVSANPEK